MGRTKKDKKEDIKGPIIREAIEEEQTHQCFCGTRLLITETTCGSSECVKLADQFGTVQQWLQQESFINFAIDSSYADEKSEEKVLNVLKNVFGSSQKNIAFETGLATSTISNTLTRLERKGLVWQDEFHDDRGNLLKKKRGRRGVIWRIS
ncbi:MAG: helix-turn-helix transcriptional regulator [Candidatus Hodarchaeales archaeon]|jgi:predicted Rossmann fold nucleotide-binding protein DprA/Smf involved in DNA uptake